MLHNMFLDFCKIITSYCSFTLNNLFFFLDNNSLSLNPDFVVAVNVVVFPTIFPMIGSLEVLKVLLFKFLNEVPYLGTLLRFLVMGFAFFPYL